MLRGFCFMNVLDMRVLREQTGKHKGYDILATVPLAFMPTYIFQFVQYYKTTKEQWKRCAPGAESPSLMLSC